MRARGRTITITHNELWLIMAVSAVAGLGVAIVFFAGTGSNWQLLWLALGLFCAGCIGQIVREARRRDAGTRPDLPLTTD